MSAVGRNEPCPCYSGKKYKHCCMMTSAISSAADEAISPIDALNVAWGLLESGQSTEAASLCRTILRSDAAQPDALYLLGVFACENGDVRDAIELFHRAALARPQFPEAHYYLGLVHMWHAQFEKAASHYRQAISSAPGFLDFLLTRDKEPEYEGCLNSLLSSLSLLINYLTLLRIMVLLLSLIYFSSLLLLILFSFSPSRLFFLSFFSF